MRPTPRILLEQANQPFLLVSNPTNVRYLTGVADSGGVVLVTPRSFVLFVDALSYDEALQHAGRSTLVRSSADLPKAMAKVPECGFEESDVTVARFRRWKRDFPMTKLLRTTDAVEDFRRTKDEDELRLIRRAHRITEELLRRVPAALRKGITEKALAWKLETWARDLGAEGMAFAPVVAFGTHTSHPHHHPTTRALQKGHLVQIDVGATYRGYRADRSQVYFTDEPTIAQAQVLEALTEAKNEAIAASCIGASTRALDHLARDTLKRHGFDKYFTHSLGHGVGLDIHEGVTLSMRRPDDALRANEVITIEPGVYLPGKFGMRLEEMVIVS